MNHSKYVFSQLTSFLNRSQFNDYVRKYHGDKYVKHFTCWNQLLTLMFGQLSNRESLRDLITIIEAHHQKCYHLGLGKHVTRSNLAKANTNRDYRIFEDFAFFHITTASVHDSQAMKEILVETGAYYIFDRGYNNFKELYRIHRMESFFVVRAKNNLQYKCVTWRRRLPKGILTDAEIELTIYKSQKDYPEHLRLVRFYDDEQQREFMFLTNAMELTALQVADLYKNRWQIELFFKWLKQHLKIKKFWGTSENAVRIQIYSAISVYCLVAIVQHDMLLDRSTYEVLQILSMSLTDTTHLKELFDKTTFKNDKDRSGSSEPDLFENFKF